MIPTYVTLLLILTTLIALISTVKYFQLLDEHQTTVAKYKALLRMVENHK